MFHVTDSGMRSSCTSPALNPLMGVINQDIGYLSRRHGPPERTKHTKKEDEECGWAEEPNLTFNMHADMCVSKIFINTPADL